MGSVPSRIIGVTWIENTLSQDHQPRFTFPVATRHRIPAVKESIVVADLRRLNSDLQDAFESYTR